jgi:hypothetical protein
MKRDPVLSKEVLGGIDPSCIRVTNLDNFVMLSTIQTNAKIKLSPVEGLQTQTNVYLISVNTKIAKKYGAMAKDGSGSHKSTYTRKRRFSTDSCRGNYPHK